MTQYHIIPNPKAHEPPFILIARIAGEEKKERIEEVFDFLKLLFVKGCSPKTLRAYAYDLLAFYRFLEEKHLILDILQANHFSDFILSHRRDKAAPRTINRRLTTVRSFLNSVDAGRGDALFGKLCPAFYKGAKNKALLGKTRLKNIRMKRFTVKVPQVILRPLLPGEIKAFLTGLRKYRDQAIVLLMALCGLRSCEVLSLEMDDVDLIALKLYVRGKGMRPRVLPLSPAVSKVLSHYLDYERPVCAHNLCFVALKGKKRGQPLGTAGLRKLFRTRRKNSRSIARAHPHLFRHSFCTHLIREGVSLAVVQKLMGHSDIEVTMSYVHLSDHDLTQEYHRAIQSIQGESQNGDGGGT